MVPCRADRNLAWRRVAIEGVCTIFRNARQFHHMPPSRTSGPKGLPARGFMRGRETERDYTAAGMTLRAAHKGVRSGPAVEWASDGVGRDKHG